MNFGLKNVYFLAFVKNPKSNAKLKSDNPLFRNLHKSLLKCCFFVLRNQMSINIIYYIPGMACFIPGHEGKDLGDHWVRFLQNVSKYGRKSEIDEEFERF